MSAPKIQLHRLHRKSLLTLTDRLRASLAALDRSSIRAEFDKLRETVDRHLPASRLAGIASEMPLEQRAFLTWKYRRGTCIRMNCSGKAGHGSVGTVKEILVHSGPAILDYWEYRVEWESGSLAPGTGLCPERWAEEVTKGQG